MEMRKLGNSGLRIAPLMFGGNVFGWTADEAMSFKLLDGFVGAGLNAIDTADVYSKWVPGHKGGESETVVGNWLKARGGRDKVVIATKVGLEMPGVGQGLRRDYILQRVEDSLKRLQTDYIDLYQSHTDDKDAPLDETLAAYDQLMKQGKVRAIGASNYDAQRLAEAVDVSAAKKLPRYETLQPHYNLYERADYERALEPLVLKQGIGVIPYYSLASGFLTGKYRTEADFNQHQANQPIWIRAQAIGASPTTLRIKAWANGALEPTAWNYTATNSEAVLQSAGAVGLRTNIGTPTTNAPVTFSFDGFRANAPAPVDAVAPAAPTGLTAAPGNNAVYLGWNANPEPDLVGYHVYRSTTSPVSTSGAPLSGTEPVTTTSYVDTTAVNGTQYFYVITAVDASTNRSGPSNTASATPDASAGSALDFDGVNDHVTFGPAPDMGVTTFTIETWFRRDGPGVAVATSGGAGGVTAVPLLTKGSSESDGSNTDMNYFLGIRSSDNVLAADFEDNATGANHSVAGSTPITNGVWHHAAATFNGTTWRLYLDGVLDATFNIGSFTPRSDSIQHGALATTINSTGQSAGFFDGRLDEPRVWNVARTQGQIATARDLQLTSGNGLVARWGLNEGSGNALANSVSGGSTGTAVGGPLWVPGAPFAASTDPAPAAPTGLGATPGPGRVDLAWTANSEPDIAGYNVYRGGAISGPTVNALAAGDIASCSSSGDEATAALLDNLPGTVLALGDNVYEDGTIAEFNNCYNPTWGRAKARTAPAAGNHEYQTGNANGYFTYFGAAAGNPTQGYYSYDYGTWHVIVLNSNCANVSCSAGSTQEQWLRADLAANTDEQCTLAYWHHPRFSSGDSHGNDPATAPFWNALYEFNADLILTGHDHTYERFAPQTPGAAADPEHGIRQFVVGTGGRSHNGFNTPEPNSQVRNGDTYGVLNLTLKPGGYDWQFVPEAGRTFTDSGSDACHDAGGPVTSATPINGDALVAGPSYTDTSVSAGTEYHYTVTAVDAAGHESAVSNEASATPDPSTNNALDFDGANDHVTLGGASAFNSNTFTVETWFRRDGAGAAAITSSTPGGVTAIPLLAKGRSGGGVINWFLGIDSTTNRVAADFESADDTNHGIVGTTTLVNGTWYHAAATYDGTTFRLYLNGVQEASVAAASGPGTGSNHPAAFATALDPAGVPAGFFNGVIDEARIWSVSRTPAQILAARDQELTTGAGLTARYGINEGSGVIVGNSVSGGVNGSAVGGPLWVAGSPFSVPDTAPSAPTGLVASAGNNSVGLSWTTNPEGDIAGYRVYRSTTSPVSTVGTPLSGATLVTSPSYTDATAANGTTYFYVVTAVDAAGNASGASNQASATPAAGSGAALDFDGTNDHVTLGGQSAFNGNTFTIETWFRRDGTGVATGTSGTTPGLVSVIPLVTKGRTGGTAQIVNWFLGIDTATNRIAADFETAADDVNHGLMGTTTLVTGTWYHAAATYDGATFRVYLNGVQENAAAVAGGPGTGSTHPAALGTALDTTGATGGFFNGVLDEVRIWNVARSAAEIAAARNLELTSGTGLTARYGLNEGTGNAVGNSVVGGVNGLAVNGPTWVPGAPFGGGGDPPPDAPTGVAATPGNNSVTLTWSANSEPDLAGYNVYRDGAPAGPTVQAVGAGDIASCSSSGDEATAALLATISGDVLALGDTVYDNGTTDEYNNCYAPSWGVEKARTHPVVGNHEYGTAGASGYFGYFGAAAGTPGQGYYSYDYGEWHVIVLNSMCANVGGCGVGSDQHNWLLLDLAANDEQCTMALWHHPRFSSAANHGSDPITQPLYQALYDANADLILTGHDHSYERFAPQTATGVLDLNRGIRQFVVGTGGRSHYAQGTVRPNSEIYNGDTYGVIKLQLKPTSYDWEFVPEAGRTFADTGSQACHDANGLLAGGAPLNGSTLITGTSFTDTTAVNGTTYNYTVTAVDDADQESAPSAGVSATPATGSALDFDGVDDHVTFGASPSLNSNTFTIETWFRRDGTGVPAITSGTVPPGLTAIPLLTKGRSEAGALLNWFLGIDSATNRIAADFESASDDANHGIIGTTTLVNGTWYHAAATYDGTTFRLFLNGVEEASVADADGPGTGSAHHAALATALSTTGVPEGFFNGVLDEARVWSVARTSAQILAAKDQELSSGTGLIARYGLNEGTGTAVGNSVAGGVNGNALNGPVWTAGAPFGGGANQAPVFSTDITDQANSEGNVVSLDADATDPNPGDTLTYSATNLPTNLTINSSTGVISGTLGVGSAGTYNVVITVSDGALTDTDPFIWTVTVPGSGSALDFDGTNDHVTLGGQSAFNGNTFTIETWFRRDGTGVATGTSGTTPGLVSVIPLVTKGRTGGTAQIVNWFLGIDTATNRIAADFETAADDVNHGLMGTTTLVTGTWYHAAATYDGATFRVYLNGVQENAAAVAGGPGTGSTHPAALGTALDTTGATGGFFNGVLDEVRIWNVARSAAEIAAARNLELTSGTGLTARYGLNEGTGTAVGNSVVGGVNGLAVNGPTWVPGAPFGGGGNQAPAFSTDITDQSDNEGEVVSLDADATDADLDSLTYSATNLPDGITINPSTGVISGTLSATSAGVYSVTVTVSDGSLTDTDPFTWTVTDPSPSATGLDFDGTNDHVTLGPASGLNSNTFTVETWFRREGTGVMATTTSGAGGVSAAPLMAKGLSGGGTINWFLGVTSTGLLAADFESASDDSNHGITGTSLVDNGEWHHAAATYDGTTLRLYLDGTQEASTTVSQGPGTGSNHPPSLATALTPTGVATGFFNGVLDEARVWSVARTLSADSRRHEPADHVGQRPHGSLGHE